LPFDVCVCYGPDDRELGQRLQNELEGDGRRVTLPGQGAAPDPARLGVPEVDFGGARLAVVLVTRRWTAAGGIGAVMALAERTGTEALLVWWDEDAPSDFAGSRRPDESIFYACYLPQGERLRAVADEIGKRLDAA
jgi:hypothetical protein